MFTCNLPQPVVDALRFQRDCFESNSFAAVVQVLARLGYAPRALNEKACCGLTWISTGQLDGARRQLRHAAAVLAPFVEQGIPIVGVEPSCTSVWRSDAPELLPGDTNVKALKGKVLTLAEFLAKDPDFLPPDLSGHTIVAFPTSLRTLRRLLTAAFTWA